MLGRTMAELILHHFETSPFSEKVRRVLACKRMPWKSVLVPPMLPKPDVVELTGGYRRTPFLQIGADVYCDTALICEVLDRLQPLPPIYPAAAGGVARILAHWADTTLFWAAVAGPRNPARMNGGLPPGSAQAFGEDRKAMFGPMKLLPAPDAAAALGCHVQRLSDTLGSQRFLLGEAPSIADFSAYHPLWLTRMRHPAEADVLARTPNLRDWMDRMEALGPQDGQEFDAPRAIAVAAAAQPLPVGAGPLDGGEFVDRHGIAPGEQVTITAESFGAEPTSGVLMAASREHYTLRRTGPRAGTVHVHFPRVGYVLARA
jgi:glutathione S-transferase